MQDIELDTNRGPTDLPTTEAWAALAHRISNDGIAIHHEVVCDLLRSLRDRRYADDRLLVQLAGIVGDAAAAPIVRERAFGRLAAQVERLRRSAPSATGRRLSEPAPTARAA